MSNFQILVKHVHGQTLCLQVGTSNLSGSLLREHLEESLKIPGKLFRITSGCYDVKDETILKPDASGNYPSCSLTFRLLGGKGGFGSLLRGAATKAGQKKTRNFDACRDMSGRRLRHVNAEKKLMEWKATEKERELAKVGEEYLKKLSKEQKAIEDGRKLRPEVREEDEVVNESPLEKVAAAVQTGLEEARKLEEKRKRKLETNKNESKKLKIFSMLEEVGVSDDDDDDDDDMVEKNTERKNEENVQSSSDGGPGSVSENLSGEHLEKNEAENVVSKDKEEDSEQKPPVEEIKLSVTVEVNSTTPQSESATKDPVVLDGELDFDKFESPSSLENLGLERLKAELQVRGLKCGGSLTERAARLFLLKNTPISEIDKKHLAKPMGGKRK